MATEFALIPEHQTFFASDGSLASGYQLFIYSAGSSTKATTHAESDGVTANPNPIVLNSLGQTPNGVYVATGLYKTVLASDTDTDPPATAIRTRDNITARNDATAAAKSEWVDGPTPTYISGTSFSLVGDQTSAFHVGRRLKITDSGGTSYAYISATAYTSLTTVTVVNDASVIDSGLSAVSYGILAADTGSVPGLSNAASAGQHLGTDGTTTGWKSGGWEFISSATISADATIEFTHSGIDTGDDFVTGYSYLIDFDKVVGTDANQLFLQAYASSAYLATGYSFGAFGAVSTTPLSAENLSATTITASAAWGTGAGEECSGSILIRGAAYSDRPMTMTSRSAGRNATPSWNTFTIEGRLNADTVVKKVKIYESSSTLTSGFVRLYRRKDA